jgi:hypothetical protein
MWPCRTARCAGRRNGAGKAVIHDATNPITTVLPTPRPKAGAIARLAREPALFTRLLAVNNGTRTLADTACTGGTP